MSSESNASIIASNLGKKYQMYDSPHLRLKQLFFGRTGRKYYKDFNALSGVSFVVERGSSMGVIGRNGAGKSTLLQLIAGTLRPTSGSIEVHGRVAAVLELGAGFNPEFSGRENIKLYCNILQMPQAMIEAKFAQIVEFSELAEFIDQPIKTYSSGMIARLAFSVIAHVDADVLIIDEALSVGDAAFSQKCMRFLRDFKERGTIFFVSHDISAIKTFCDQTLWIDHGQMKAIGNTKEVCDAYLASIYPSAKPQVAPAPERIPGPPLTAQAQEPLQRTARAEVRTITPSPTRHAVGTEKMVIDAFRFNPSSANFGTGEAEIIDLTLSNEKGEPLNYIEAPVQATVRISIDIKVDLTAPIVGFFVKDRLGQPLFGGNTYLTYEGNTPSVGSGEQLVATFQFRMPTLLAGDYSISAAIASGTLEEHTQLHWVNDAAMFKVLASTLDGVLVGVPIDRIELTPVPAAVT